MSKEAAGIGEPSRRPHDVGLAGTRESQALSLRSLSCTRMSRGFPGQFSSGGEQHGSVLLACKGAGRSQPANSLGSRATPGCLSFP